MVHVDKLSMYSKTEEFEDDSDNRESCNEAYAPKQSECVIDEEQYDKIEHRYNLRSMNFCII